MAKVFEVNVDSRIYAGEHERFYIKARSAGEASRRALTLARRNGFLNKRSIYVESIKLIGELQ